MLYIFFPKLLDTHSRERERERDRQTDRQTDRQIDRQTGRDRGLLMDIIGRYI